MANTFEPVIYVDEDNQVYFSLEEAVDGLSSCGEGKPLAIYELKQTGTVTPSFVPDKNKNTKKAGNK